MSNEIKVFENAEFGSVRTLVINGEPYEMLSVSTLMTKTRE